MHIFAKTNVNNGAIFRTRLPSNPRPSIRDCMHLVTCVHFRSRDKDGGHTIQSTIAKNPMLHTNFMALCFIELELPYCKDWWIRDLWPFLLLWPWPWPDVMKCNVNVKFEVTLHEQVRYRGTLQYYSLSHSWPSHTNMTRIPCRYIGFGNMNFLWQGFRKLSSDRHTEIIYHTALWAVNDQNGQRSESQAQIKMVCTGK